MSEPDGWLAPYSTADIRWTKRLHVRLAFAFSALIIAAGFVVPEIRDLLRHLLETGSGTEGGPSERAIDTIDTAFIVIFLMATAGVAGWIVSLLVTRRLREMVNVLRNPIEADEGVPYPEEAEQRDEIGQLAGAMNHMQVRIRELVSSLKGRDRDRRRWLSRISHDIRTPLTALIACINRARKVAGELPGGDDRTKLLEALRVAQLDAARFHALASDLLDVARLEDEDLQMVREPVPPIELVRSVVTSLKLLAEDLGKSIVIDAPGAVPELEADGHRLARALENLLRNALYHGKTEVIVRVEGAGDSVQFSVLDDGPGMPVSDDGEVDLDQLADLPGRRDSTGIGLLVARRVATGHNGAIGATNRPTGGALVWFRIPRPAVAPH